MPPIPAGLSRLWHSSKVWTGIATVLLSLGPELISNFTTYGLSANSAHVLALVTALLGKAIIEAIGAEDAALKASLPPPPVPPEIAAQVAAPRLSLGSSTHGA